MAWQGARLRPSRYSASGGSRRPQRKIEHRSLPPASIAASDSVRTERKGERRPLAPRRSGMSPNASHRVRPGLSSAASLITTLLISFDQEVLNQHLNLVTPEYPFFESPCVGFRAPLLRAVAVMGLPTGSQVAGFGEAPLRVGVESMQTRGGWLPVGLGFGLTERGWACAETGVACEAGGGAAGRRDDRDRGRAH